ncbi:MAG: Ig-like domain-containing protein, partial [Verrucomicrobiae bacterium]|nr:Ig-like domain-containing protein [Verrucomicrobiae bacterium]
MNKTHLIIPMIGAGLALGGGLARAGSFSSDFSDPGQTGFILTSNDGTGTWMPAITDGHLVLTPAENSRQGSMIIDALDGRTAIDGFTASFKLQIGPGSGNAADGFSFCFCPELTDTSNFGEEGMGTGITVCFDIYNNGTGEAPAVDVKYRGNLLATTKYAKADVVTSQFEDVLVEVSPAGTLNLTWKGIKVYENLVLPGFKPLSGRFGFGARTGGENAAQWIDDVSITTTPVPASPPSLVWAGGSAAFTTVTVGFDEPVDPATAQTIANYQLTGGVTVQAAALAAPSGSPGDNLVVLTTSQQPEDTLLTLTVNNVKDLDGNPVPADSTTEFRTFVWLPNVVTWERWDDGITIGNLYNQVTNPNSLRGPGLTWLTSSFESGRHAGAPEWYGARGYTWFTPATTGDYEFLLTCDDNGRALLSTDADPANVFGIAAETGSSGERTWTSTAAVSEQYSYTYLTSFDDTALGIEPYPGWGFVNLQAGQKYFMEVLWQEATSGDGAELTIIKSGDAIPADGTPADTAGGTLGCYYDPNTVLGFVTQPTDQVGVLGSAGVEIYSEDFTGGDGGFTVENNIEPPANWGPWVYSAADGQWIAQGSDPNCGGPFNSNLTSPGITLAEGGTVTLNFTHRYRLEGDLWDAGLVRVSVNGGDFTYLPAANFSANGYAEQGTIIGNGIAQGLLGFNGDSPGFADGDLITSTVLLGTFKQNDTIKVQFVGAWDDCWSPGQPGWVMDSLNLQQLPMVIVDFADGDGGFTVENSGEPPANWGPWEYNATEGQWIAQGSDPNCG